MATTLYSHTLRILTCAGCGAPIDASLEGGTLTCLYCGATNRLARRDEHADLARAREQASISESERHARLRAQDAQGEPLPDAIARMVENGHLPPHRVQEAETAWRDARAQLAVAPSFPVSERLFHLTVLLVPHLDERRQRATLETAVELLPDEGHRHILRCVLARLAAAAGDVTAAEAWLEPCHPRPLDLGMDTAYRLARATIAHVRGDAQAVVQQLGMQPGDVPLADRDEMLGWLLRVDALERLGRLEDARDELEAWIRHHGVPALEHAIAAQRPLALCPRAFAAARRQVFDENRDARRRHQQAVVDRLRAEHATVAARWFDAGKVVGFVVLTAVGAFGVGGLWSCILFNAVETDPLLGGSAAVICPRVCVGCRGPYRIASWSTTTNNQSTTSSSETYCSDPGGAIAAMPQNEFWLAAVNGDPRLSPYRVPGGGWMVGAFTIVAFTPVGMILALLALVKGYRRRRRRREELAAELHRAETELARL